MRDNLIMYRQKSTVHASWALLPSGWKSDVVVIVDGGRIVSIAVGQDRDDQKIARQVDVLVPAPANGHSHCFQIAFAGRTEFRALGRDDFWSWREQMYRWALALAPEELEDLAAWAFCRMLESGYGAVGEFHYLHNDPEGRSYTAPDELSRRVMRAAERDGIGLTHLPVLYNRAGIGRPAEHAQRRFTLTLDDYLDLIERLDAAVSMADHRVGVAPHSLRAVGAGELRRLVDHFAASGSGRPFHLHIAEQVAEVDEVVQHRGRTPVRWLLDEFDLDARWCLVHGTHTDEAELSRLATTGATVCLCPITEASLGDGVFRAGHFLSAEGRIAVGTDSNVRIGLAEELRTLEYGQSLTERRRNVLAPLDGGSVARYLLDRVTEGAARAIGRHTGEIATGFWADLVALGGDLTADLSTRVDPADPSVELDRLLDRWIFCEPADSVQDVWSAGRHVVQGGLHPRHDELRRAAERATTAILRRM